MLEIQELSKSYGQQMAVDKISFMIPDGQVGILLGPNGAGKSTIIKCIAGLLRYDGRIGIQGLFAKSLEAKKLFAYVPEMPAMFDALTVREHIEYVRKAYNSQITDGEVEELLKRFELYDKQEKLGNELSKGMMQKVSICCALSVMPKVILLDEPMIGLDPQAIKELKDVVLELREEGATILISTHMLEMVKELWDVMFVMDKSHIIGSYKRDEVGTKELEDLFFEMTSSKEADGIAAESSKEADGIAAESSKEADGIAAESSKEADGIAAESSKEADGSAAESSNGSVGSAADSTKGTGGGEE